MFLFSFILLKLILTAAEQNSDTGYCDINTKTCHTLEDFEGQKFLFYEVNPPEGFNLRRDVYMRFAITLAEAQGSGKKGDWKLVLPPWHHLYHWKSQTSSTKPAPWSDFFDINSLKSYAPVVELHEIFSKTSSKALELDRIYVLQNFENAFEGGTFVEKWEIVGLCEYYGPFWGYNNITAKEVLCVKFQGKNSKLWELISLHPTDKKVMITHGEIPLHNTYGSKQYWDCRKSMKFNTDLIKTAKDYIDKHLDCKKDTCTTYISIHWRRQDFARSRRSEVPSLTGTVKQIDEFIKKNMTIIQKIFIASDASKSELESLENQLKALNYKVYFYMPSKSDLDKYRDGGVAIIEQIICSHGAYFIGTHESTFTFRIQEEREILGFDSHTTFNRLCPDTGRCESLSKWTIQN